MPFPVLFVSPLPVSRPCHPSATTTITTTTRSSTLLRVAYRRPRHHPQYSTTTTTTTSSSSSSVNNPSEQNNNNNNKTDDDEWLNLSRSIRSDDDDTHQSPTSHIPSNNFDPDSDRHAWDLWNNSNSPSTTTTTTTTSSTNAGEPSFWRAAARDMQMQVGSDTDNEQENVWRKAREVTGEVNDLQNKLADQLSSFHLSSSSPPTDMYKSTARELSIGSGWNPDTDWRRFDDITRTDAMDADATQRAEFVRNLEEQDVEDVEYDKSPTTMDFKMNGEVQPGFLANRQRNDSTYGAGRKNAQVQAEQLVAQGEQLRDPLSDARAWMQAAKEVGGGSDEMKEKVEEGKRELESEGYEGLINSKSEKEEKENDWNVWNSWYTASIQYNADNADIKERDARQEVDQWRASARDLLSSTTTTTTSEQESSDLSAPPSAPQESSGAWDAWRQADEQWKASLNGEGQGTENGMDFNSMGVREDWGAGMGKTSSERAAWESWKRATNEVGNDQQRWWSNRLDDSNMNESVMKDVGIIDDRKKKQVIIINKQDRLDSNETLNMWRSVAKQVTRSDENKNERQ